MKRFGSGFIRMMPMGRPITQGKGEAAGFEELAMPVMDSAYNLARWLARNDHDAEDLVQETYLKAFRNFHSFQAGTVRSVRGYQRRRAATQLAAVANPAG